MDRFWILAAHRDALSLEQMGEWKLSSKRENRIRIHVSREWHLSVYAMFRNVWLVATLIVEGGTKGSSIVGEV